MWRTVCSTMVVGALLLVTDAGVAAPPVFSADVSGIELAPQSIAGAAIFLFFVEGEIDGQFRRGLGWIAVNHELLPEAEGESSAITGGSGAIWVGLRRYEVAVTGGELILFDAKDPDIFDDAFVANMTVAISRRGESGEHLFMGLLDHEPFPPTIEGPLGPPVVEEVPEEEMPFEEGPVEELPTKSAEPLLAG